MVGTRIQYISSGAKPHQCRAPDLQSCSCRCALLQGTKNAWGCRTSPESSLSHVEDLSVPSGLPRHHHWRRSLPADNQTPELFLSSQQPVPATSHPFTSTTT